MLVGWVFGFKTPRLIRFGAQLMIVSACSKCYCHQAIIRKSYRIKNPKVLRKSPKSKLGVRSWKFAQSTTRRMRKKDYPGEIFILLHFRYFWSFWFSWIFPYEIKGNYYRNSIGIPAKTQKIKNIENEAKWNFLQDSPFFAFVLWYFVQIFSF